MLGDTLRRLPEMHEWKTTGPPAKRKNIFA
jgi:hypothetical protein